MSGSVGTLVKAIDLPPAGAWRAPIAALWAECMAIAALVPILLLAAFWNGFPFTFFDTGAYVLQGLALHFVPERDAAYSLFLRFAGVHRSLWYVAIVQAVATAFMLVQLVRARAPATALWQVPCLGLALVLLTGAGWYVGQIEPDCFTPLAVIAIYLLAFHLEALGVARAIAAAAIGAFAVAAHPSNLGLAAGLTTAVVGLAIIAARMPQSALPQINARWPAAVFAGGIGIVLGCNFVITDKVFLSRSGAVFFTARLIEDGVIKRVLDQDCPSPGLRLCRYRNALPPTADAWLWHDNSSFTALGRFEGMEKESERLVAASLDRFPVQVLAMSMWNGARQFTMFRTGDGIGRQRREQTWLFNGFLSSQRPQFQKARQEEDGYPFAAINVIHVGLATLALAMLTIVLWNAMRRRDWNAAAFPAFILLALVLNALVCGAVSGPHDRYQGRLIWIVPLAVLLLPRGQVSAALRLRGESGT